MINVANPATPLPAAVTRVLSKKFVFTGILCPQKTLCGEIVIIRTMYDLLPYTPTIIHSRVEFFAPRRATTLINAYLYGGFKKSLYSYIGI